MLYIVCLCDVLQFPLAAISCSLTVRLLLLRALRHSWTHLTGLADAGAVVVCLTGHCWSPVLLGAACQNRWPQWLELLGHCGIVKCRFRCCCLCCREVETLILGNILAIVVLKVLCFAFPATPQSRCSGSYTSNNSLTIVVVVLTAAFVVVVAASCVSCAFATLASFLGLNDMQRGGCFCCCRCCCCCRGGCRCHCCCRSSGCYIRVDF